MNYRIPLVRVSLVRDGSYPAEAKQIGSPQDAAALLQRFFEGADREQVVAVCLDTKHRIVALHVVAIGTLSEAPVHPREVFKAAILANAAAVILAHNHPSGDPSPSRADREVWERLRKVGDLLGIPVLDSVVIGADGTYTSLKEEEQR